MTAQLDQTLKDLGDKVSDADRGEIESKIEALKQAAKGDDVTAMRRAIEEAQQSFASVSQRLYEAASAQAQAEGTTGGPTTSDSTEAGGGSSAAEGEVIDAEFTTDDNQK